MGKLKEKLLNGLTEEQMEERFGLSAFEFVEYMENYKNIQPDSEVLDKMLDEQTELENEFYKQQNINEEN